MPANLPPHYFEAEKRFRTAKNPADKIAALEEMMAIMPKHKGTDHLRADLRRKMAKLFQGQGKKAAIHRASMLIDKEGAAQVVVIGPPNSGKSQLVASVTNASPMVAEYPFTTHNATPGMMTFENIQIQLIDTPPLVSQGYDYWLPHMIRRANALLLVVDLGAAPLPQMAAMFGELQLMGVEISGRPTGEVAVITRKKVLVVGNKQDQANSAQHLEMLRQEYPRLPLIAVSASTGIGLDGLRQAVYHLLGIIRVYTKTPGQKPDFTDPIILATGSTLQDAAAQVHKDFVRNLKFARIWGSGKHDGLRVKRDHILQDNDIIELHT